MSTTGSYQASIVRRLLQDCSDAAVVVEDPTRHLESVLKPPGQLGRLILKMGPKVPCLALCMNPRRFIVPQFLSVTVSQPSTRNTSTMTSEPSVSHLRKLGSEMLSCRHRPENHCHRPCNWLFRESSARCWSKIKINSFVHAENEGSQAQEYLPASNGSQGSQGGPRRVVC